MDNGKAYSTIACSSGTSTTVYIDFQIVWQFIVDDMGQFVDILLNDSGSGNTQDQWGLGEVLVVFSNHKGEKFAEVRWLVHLREVLDREFVRRFVFQLFLFAVSNSLHTLVCPVLSV